MAVTIRGEAVLPLDQLTVWAHLNDPVTLRRCITGCERLERRGDELTATVSVRVGPLRPTFEGRIILSGIDAPRGCLLAAEGRGGLAGFARGLARVSLDAVPGGTRVGYEIEAGVGGLLQRYGAPLIDGFARRMADQFFAAFVREAGRDASTPPSAAALAAARRGG